MAQTQEAQGRRFKMTWLAFLSLIGMVGLSTLLFALWGEKYVDLDSDPHTEYLAPPWTEGNFFLDRFPVIVGLPFAAAFSLFLVVFLRQTTGPIEAKVAGFEFKGQSGPVVLWILCFLAIAASIKILW
ncbi:hypothetical protein G9X67_14760 [Rhizobium sp. WYCCWR 11152]|uniref:hypothetical protein n=1 Tax=Rhizobium sp. WYCCWR 11152 TaxID=2692316 RepID=UPI0014923060|nr:hypothetical protein [Rhizobium sp. WYCCWR 11152]NNU66537.1 hypothetical protein [Rhizobium sp. WYCCWR 11152]